MVVEPSISLVRLDPFKCFVVFAGMESSKSGFPAIGRNCRKVPTIARNKTLQKLNSFLRTRRRFEHGHLSPFPVSGSAGTCSTITRISTRTTATLDKFRPEFVTALRYKGGGARYSTGSS